MIQRALNRRNAGASYETPWIATEQINLDTGKMEFIKSVQIMWDGLATLGLFDSAVTVKLTNEINQETIYTTFVCNNASNKTNTTLFEITPYIKYIKFAYNSGSVTTGEISVTLNYNRSEN